MRRFGKLRLQVGHEHGVGCERAAPGEAGTSWLSPTLRVDRKVVMMRVFDAPRRAVFDALTKPDLVKRWLVGPPGWSMVVCDIDLKVGGAYRYVWRRHCDGADVAMGGIFRELVPPERAVQTERFDEDDDPGEALVTIVLAERGGKTTLTRMTTVVPGHSPCASRRGRHS
jgi:uncharacterized protein YndB with AHSA1/START domain